MASDHGTRIYGRASIVLGWLLAALLGAHMFLTVHMPRLEKTSLAREELRSWHYLLGLTLFVVLCLRLSRWWRERPPPVPGMTAAGHHWARTLAATTYVVLVIMPVLGLGQAWTEGLTVRLGPFLEMPALVAESRGGWMFFGYFHSAFAFATLLLTLASVLTAAWLWVRRGVGLRSAFPPGFGAQAWLLMLINLYAMSTFREPGNPVPALGGYLGLTAVAWGLGVWLRGRRAGTVIATARAGVAARGVAALAAAALVALAAYGPYATFRVTPWPIGEVIVAPAGRTSHEAPVMQVTVAPETEFERRVMAETYKWCRFCHTVEKDAKHLAGPNLYAVFGQRAATAPNFHYSKAMAAAGRNGLVWDDATLDRYLAGPDEFLPGTSMTISIGPISDPATRAAVINILKRETMTAAP